MDRAKRTVYTQDFALLEPTVEDRDIAKRLGMLRAVCHGQGIALCRAQCIYLGSGGRADRHAHARHLLQL